MCDASSTTYKIFTYIFTVIAFICTISVPLFGAFNSLNIGGIFSRSVGNISDKYFLELTPSGYVFGTIWPIIFLWTILGKIYLIVSLFLPANKSPIKMRPALTPLSYLIVVSLSFTEATAWYFAFSAESLGWSFALLISAAIDASISIGITLKCTANIDEANLGSNKVATWLVRILVQNGLCVYATWITVASTLGLIMLIVYVDSPASMVAIERGLISNVTGTSIGLAILLFLILVWFILENFVLEKYLRYIFTIYPVLILAFSGVVYKLQQNGSQQNLIFSSVNLALSTALLLARIVISVYRYLQRKRQSVNEKGIEL